MLETSQAKCFWQKREIRDKLKKNPAYFWIQTSVQCWTMSVAGLFYCCRCSRYFFSRFVGSQLNSPFVASPHSMALRSVRFFFKYKYCAWEHVLGSTFFKLQNMLIRARILYSRQPVINCISGFIYLPTRRFIFWNDRHKLRTRRW